MSSPETHLTLKNQIITGSLPLIPQYGWSWEALKQGALAAGLETWQVERVFNTLTEAIEHWHSMTDQHMLAACPPEALANLKIREKISALVMARLQYLDPYKESYAQALKHLNFKIHLCSEMKLLSQTLNEIWYAAGDTSTDYNHYTKRLLLGGVYSATIAYWLKNSPTNLEQVESFLIRRINNVMQIHKIKAKGKYLINKASIFFKKTNKETNTDR